MIPDDPAEGIELEQTRWVWTPADVAATLYTITLCALILMFAVWILFV